jgi:DNA-binding MarR family transcriptional regulator/GNAT superfamily N-acetyltransferase
MSENADQISAIRTFNRFYTKVIGLLDDGILKSPFALAEARIIHEIGKLDHTTSATLARTLGMDPGQLSRLVSRLTDRNMIAVTPSREDARAADLTLTSSGQVACSELNSLSDTAAANLLAPLVSGQRQALIVAMRTITDLVGGAPSTETTFRDHDIGELGWLIHRQSRLYHEEYGWNGDFEALIAQIYAEFALAPSPVSKKLWIAERHGAIAGSVFILPSAADPAVAQLRMLYVEAWARGSGLGHRLVGEAVSFSRAAGYRGIMLWTQDCLAAARSVYKAAGFALAREEKHHSFGKDLNGQFWELTLD